MPFPIAAAVLGAAGNTLGGFLARREADDAARDATEFITTAEQGAANRLSTFFGEAAGEIGAEFGGAANRLTAAREGEAQAAGQAAQERIGGLSEAENRLLAGLEEFRGAEAGGVAAGQGFLDPELQSARAAQQQLDAATGALGPEAQQEFFDRFENDPGFAAEVEAGLDAVKRFQASQGQLSSGATLDALRQEAQKQRRGAFTDRLAQLRQTASGAPGLATSSANLASGSGQRVANALLAQGAQRGNLAISRGAERGRGLTDPAALRREGVTGANALNLQGTAARLGLQGQGEQAQAQGQLNIGNALARRRTAEGQNQANFINTAARSLSDVAGAVGGAPGGSSNPLARSRSPFRTDAAGRLVGGI